MNRLRNFIVLIILIAIVTGCGKYEDGPFLSLRSKNARIEGNWKLVEYSAKSVSTAYPEDNETYTFDGANMTYEYSNVTFDPFTGQQIVTPMSDTYVYALSFEFDTKDNNCRIVETTGTTTTSDESYWTWQDGARNHEMIEVNGQVLAIKKLTNKELVLFLDMSASGQGDAATYEVEMTFEKQ